MGRVISTTYRKVFYIIDVIMLALIIGPDELKGNMYVTKNVMDKGDTETMIGIRDRYRLVVPCKYSTITPTGICSPLVRCRMENVESVLYDLKTGKMDIDDSSSSWIKIKKTAMRIEYSRLDT